MEHNYKSYYVEVVKVFQNPGLNVDYIGRPIRNKRGSPLHNPFKIGPDGDRDAVIEKYELYLQEKIEKKDQNYLEELLRLHKKGKQEGIIILGCFCRPEKRCHGDVIKKFLESNFDYLEILESIYSE